MSLASICVPDTFGSISLFGASILGVTATLVSNYSATVQTFRHTPGEEADVYTGLSFCNVTVTYTHPGQNDLIRVETLLPQPDKWNERFMGTGGGGFVAGRDPQLRLFFMVSPLADGFATATTDAGLLGPVTDWALVSKGNVNQINVHNFGARSLEEKAIIGKAVTKLAYGKDPRFSYFQGCSQGGRQGLHLAQRHPTLYDGIFANAPAAWLPEVFPGGLWPALYMNLAGGNAPHECEIDAITAAAVAACDELDGVKDGLIGVETEECLAHFDPFSLVGRSINCTKRAHPDSGDEDQIVTISELAARVVNATWTGPWKADGTKTWFGLHPGVDLTGNQPTYVDPMAGSIINTICKRRDGTNSTAAAAGVEKICRARPNPSLIVWSIYFLARDPDFDFASLTHSEFDRLSEFGVQEYLGLTAANPDLSEFHKAGGKLLSYHGTHDNLIPHRATEKYFNDTAALWPNVHDFFRFFPVFGLDHCFGGASSAPYTMLKQLQTWVENGTAPASSPVDFLDVATGDVHQRLACPFPQKAAFDRACGDPAKRECWTCAGNLAAAS